MRDQLGEIVGSLAGSLQSLEAKVRGIETVVKQADELGKKQHNGEKVCFAPERLDNVDAFDMIFNQLWLNVQELDSIHKSLSADADYAEEE